MAVVKESKQDITVTLEVKELVFDIQNKTYLTGESRKAEGKNYEATSYMEASDDNEHSYQIRRSICKAYGDLKVELGEFLKEDVTVSDNKVKKEVDENGKLTFVFSLPSNFGKASVDSLGMSMHDYIVSRAIFDWFKITNKADAGDYAAQGDQALEHAKKALYKRVRPTRPQYD